MAVVRKGIVCCMLALLMSGCMNQNPMRIEGSLSISDMQNSAEKTTFDYVLFDTLSEKTKGLSNIKNMNHNIAAVFALDREDAMIWMKDMYFPLDVLFFDKQNRLISILENLEPCPSQDNKNGESESLAEENECTLHNIPSKAKWALEVNSGIVEQYALAPGDVLSL